ncbi:hypothetical protein LCM4577_28805 [Mesorhizobium sp. LCM 4577]|nr:hypothetical protein LCM4577_28805 [Mesorhizobium sp. LCM 4577]
MPEPLQLTGPVMGSCAGLNTDQAKRQRFEIGQEITTSEPFAVNRLARCIGDMDVKNILG